MSNAASPLGFGLMCKPPRPGQSKTRLAARIGDAQASRLARAFLADSADKVAGLAGAANLRLTAFYRPEDAAEEIAEIIGPAWPCVFCDAEDLGAAMLAALAQLLRENPAGAIIMGADLPTLPPEYITAAATLLRQGDARSGVIGPSADGGYYLIGIKSLEVAPLFAPMAWSMPDVLAQTKARAKENGITLHELPQWRDIDEADDLDWLAAALEEPGSQESGRCAQATRAALDSLPETGA